MVTTIIQKSNAFMIYDDIYTLVDRIVRRFSEAKRIEQMEQSRIRTVAAAELEAPTKSSAIGLDRMSDPNFIQGKY